MMAARGAQLRRRLARVALLCVVCSVGRSAHADDATRVADDLFNAGKAAYQRGDYSAAARAFEEAQRRAPRAETSYNAGVASEAAGEPVRAANALRVALESGSLPANLAADARDRHARLAQALGLLRIDGPASASVEVTGMPREHLPFVTYLAPGAQRVLVEFAGGAREERRISIDPGARATLSFSEPPPRSPARAQPARAQPGAKPHASSGTSWQLVVGVSALGVAGIAAGTGLALGARGLAARDRFENTGRFDAAARNDALTLRTEANVALAGALAFAITGVVLLVEIPRPSAGSAFLDIGPGSVELGRRF